MFDEDKKMNERLADAADLVIDFATLGEYGLEPIDSPPASRTRTGSRNRQRSRSVGCPANRSTGSFMAAVERFSVA